MTEKHSSKFVFAAVALLLSLLSNNAAAADDEFGVWLIASSTGFLPGSGDGTPWRYAADAQFRWVDDRAGFRQYLIRPSIGYTLSNGAQLWIGFARFETGRSSRPSSHENRYWQQVNWRIGEWRGGALVALVRIEERDVSTGDDLGVVSRFMVRYTRPLNNQANQYWTVSLEPFVDFRDTDWGAEKGLGQNRAAIAWGQMINEHTVLEVGYMNQYIFRDNGPDRSNHLLTLHMKVKF